jgi:putative addiction module component (TIGR02574 family)
MEPDREIELSEEYEAELHRRLEELDSGKAKLLSLADVMARLKLPSAPKET